MRITWNYDQGKIWANYADGRRIATWEAEPAFRFLVDLLNVNQQLSALLGAVFDESALIQTGN